MSELPEIQFCETDPSVVEAQVITGYEASLATRFVADGYSETEAARLARLYPGDPVRLFLESQAYEIALLRFIIDDSAKQNLVYYAREGKLDHLGAFHGSRGARLEATAALATQQFTIDEALGFALAIPLGTRVTPDGELLFETTAAAEIPAGETEVEVQVQCQTEGAAGNGFLAGQIDRMVDSIEYVTGTENVTTTLGGSDQESDEAYRARMQLAPESYSVAGPGEGYVFWAKTASPTIIDVSVTNPSLGVVKICPLCTGGELPSQEILDAVQAILSPTTRRPLSDQPVTVAPTQVPFVLDVDYWIESGSSALVSSIQAAVTLAKTTYVTWQTTKLGRDINPSVLSSMIQGVTGVKRVVVNSPGFAPVAGDQVASLSGTATANYQGLEDE